MNIGLFDYKNICKNKLIMRLKIYIYFKRWKKPDIAAVWGRFITGNSDKESSHIVGKFL